MAGRNRLKESFATRCEPMLWQIVQQPRLAFRLEDFAAVKQPWAEKPCRSWTNVTARNAAAAR